MAAAHMTTDQVAKKLVELCKQNKAMEAVQTLYSADVVSKEATPTPDGISEMKGLDAKVGKMQWWESNHDIHSATVEGPLSAASHFSVRFTYDMTFKPTGKRATMDELGVYQVKDGKIVREEYFYA